MPSPRGDRGGGGGDAIYWPQGATGQHPAAGEGERESQRGCHQKHLSQGRERLVHRRQAFSDNNRPDVPADAVAIGDGDREMDGARLFTR